MKHTFAQIPKAEIPRSSFDRSHGYKTTFDAGYLIPFYVDEALPGDTFNLSVTAFARLATPIKPIMDNMFMETFFFSVPVRQVWDNWEKFCGEQANPDDSTDFVIPQIPADPWNTLPNLPDYFGLPVGTDQFQMSALPFRAFNKIFNHWFRDQNLIDSVPENSDDGPDPTNHYTMLRRRKRPDYFTSCLPWPQKGDAVTVPLGTSAPVGGSQALAERDFTGLPIAYRDIDAGDGNRYGQQVTATAVDWGTSVDDGSKGDLWADLTEATAVTINTLRQGFQIQKLLERDARGGTRYPEILKAHFGVTDPQMLVLQRPEFLGGGSTPISISPVQQTSETDPSGPDASPQGNLAAFGTATIQNHGFTKSFTEHCIIIGIVNVRADLTYQQGINRMWSRTTRFDFYWPALSHLGEQAVLNQEIYNQNLPADDEVFGYQERYAEYRYKPSQITGKFRSSDPESLDIWHLGQDFGALPVLGQTFIEDNPPIDRIIAVPAEPHFLFDAFINLRCARPMPLYSIPGLIDHF